MTLLHKRILIYIIIQVTVLSIQSKENLKPQLIPQDSDASISLDISPNGNYLVTGTMEGMITLWSTSTRKIIRKNETHALLISDIKFSPNGKLIASVSLDHKVLITDVLTGKKVKLFRMKDAIYSVTFSKNSRYLVVGLKDGSTNIIDINAGSYIRVFPKLDMQVKSVAISPDSKYVLSGCADGNVYMWNVNIGKLEKKFIGHKGVVSAVQFSIDGNTIISGGSDSQIICWDRFTGEIITTIKNHTDNIESISCSNNGQYVLASSTDGTVTMYSLLLSEILYQIKLPEEKNRAQWRSSGEGADRFTNNFRSTAFSNSGEEFYCTVEGNIYSFKSKTGKIENEFISNNKVQYNPDTLVLSLNEKYLYSINGSRVLQWDVTTLSLKKVLYEAPEDIQTIKLVGNNFLHITTFKNTYILDISQSNNKDNVISYKTGSYLTKITHDGLISLSSDGHNNINVREVISGKILKVLKGHSQSIKYIDIHPSGKYAISSSLDNTIRYWDLKTGKEKYQINNLSNGSYFVQFSKDGDYFYSAYKYLKKWKSLDGSIVSQSNDHNWYHCGTLSTKSNLLFIGNFNGDITCYDGVTFNENFILKGHKSLIRSIVVTKDEKYAYSNSNDGTIRMWNLNNLESVVFLTGGKDINKWIVYSDDGYWDGSNDCGDLVAMSRNLESWNIDQFSTVNNRPDILSKRMNLSDELLKQYEYAWMRRLSKLNIDENDIDFNYQIPSLKIINSKQDYTNLNGKFVDLNIEFTPNRRDIISYQIYINDVPLYSFTGNPLKNTKNIISEKIELTNGHNKVEISCKDSLGLESYRVVEEYFWNGNIKPNLYFIGFGASIYKDDQISNLKYADKDVKDLETIFNKMEGKGFNKVFSKIYTNEDVTKNNISGVKDFLKYSKPDDTLVLFIAGHGIQLKDNNNKYTYYYLTSDTNSFDIKNTAAEFEIIEQILYNIPPRNKLFLIDTCESGSLDFNNNNFENTENLSARKLEHFNSRGLNVNSTNKVSYKEKRDRWIYNDLFRRSGTIVFSASKGTEYSHESEILEQGIFTYSIIQTLSSSNHDKNNDNYISNSEFVSAVMQNVPLLIKNINPKAQQHPSIDKDNIYIDFGFPIINE